MADLSFRQAKPDEIAQVFSLLKEAALWLNQQGIDHWQDWIAPPQRFIDWIEQGFRQQEFYFLTSAQQIIGCFRLQWQDPLFWGEQSIPAGYIHSFTIKRSLAGQGIGSQALALIEDLCRANQKSHCRLDCNATVVELCHYYQQHGYLTVGQTTVQGESLLLFEKRLD